MANWVLKGLRTGVKSTAYPARSEGAPGVSPGRPRGTLLKSPAAADALVARCPTQAIARENAAISIDEGRCVHCFRCQRHVEQPASWEPGYEWAAKTSGEAALRKIAGIFGRSLHVRFVDAGACGACMSEARQINSPYYNLHRLGIFVTPTPRNADILLVAGPISDAMRLPLRKTYEAMPTPKRVVAIGACAASGGIFGPSFAALGGAAELLPVDVVVPGCPPPPLAILHGLLVAIETKPPSPLNLCGARDGFANGFAMSATELLILFFVLCGAGAVLAFLTPQRWLAILLAVIGSLAALVVLAASAMLLAFDAQFHAALWPVLNLGTLTLRSDQLSAFFLFVTGLVYLPVSIFSGTYLSKYLAHHDLRYFSILYHALFAAIVLVLVAGDAISFLVAWELMSIASYLLVNYEFERPESSRAGYVMLAMGEAGTIAVAIAFILIAGVTGGLGFSALRVAAPAMGQGLRWAVFLLSFFGFAVKAGLIPLNSWLPRAHPVAPTNVSALLSAVIVNLGIYGIMRVNLDLAPPVGAVPGLIVLVIGSVSALIGILYATIQEEMKRLLAHSTIENMGIVAAGLGAAMVFLATDHRIVGAIALVAALYHLANHSVYKALLFIGAGAVEAGTGTRDLDRLGGIIRGMPWTSAFFLVGVLSIAALPPFNGFVSEWLTLQTILRSAVLSSTVVKIIFAICGALLALTAGLAGTCFVKVFATGFLGMSRSPAAAQAREANLATRAPLALLAAFCILLGILPTYVIAAIDRAVVPLAHESAIAALVPPFFTASAQRPQNLPPAFLADFHNLGAQLGEHVLPGRGLVILHRGEARNPVVFAMSTSYMVVVLAGILAVTFLVFRMLTWRRRLARGAAWDGGLRHLTPALTYTATAFSNPVRVIFAALLTPAVDEETTEAVAVHFRTAITREYTEVHIIDRFVLQPPIAGLRNVAAITRRMHVGHVNAYAAYVLLAMLIVLVVGVGLL